MSTPSRQTPELVILFGIDTVPLTYGQQLNSGSGVGLVRKSGPAGDIVKQTRDEAKKRIKAAQSFA